MFRKTATGSSLLLLGVSAVSCLLVGCAESSSERFTPSPDAARTALEKALAEWQAGRPPGPMEGTPAIQVGDTQRRSGQVLVNYEVQGELPFENGRRFQVRLTFDKPAAEEKAQYVVVGIDPLWILRREDYDMVTHWEHPMPAPAGAAPAPSDSAVNAK